MNQVFAIVPNGAAADTDPAPLSTRRRPIAADAYDIEQAAKVLGISRPQLLKFVNKRAVTRIPATYIGTWSFPIKELNDWRRWLAVNGIAIKITRQHGLRVTGADGKVLERVEWQGGGA